MMARQSIEALKLQYAQLTPEQLILFPWILEKDLFDINIDPSTLEDVNEEKLVLKNTYNMHSESNEDNLYK